MERITSLLSVLKARGLSQVEITRRTGIPQPRLSRWASGEVPAAADDALKLQELVASVQAEAGTCGGKGEAA